MPSLWAVQFHWVFPSLVWYLCHVCGLFCNDLLLPLPGLWAGSVFLFFARGVGLPFFGWLFVGPDLGVWFVVDGVVDGASPSFLGG